LAEIDSLLASFLSNQDPSLLEKIVFDEAHPLVRRIVAWRLGPAAPQQDREDVCGDVLLELLSKVDAMRRGEGEPIANLLAYTAVTAHHGCDHYLRRRFPRRHRLRTRLRYLFETSPDYAMWEADAGETCCGLKSWNGREPRTDLVPGWQRQVPLRAGANEVRAVGAILTHLEAPVRLDDMVDAVALLLNVRDEAGSAEDVAVAADDPSTRIDQRRYIERLWTEVAQLPRPQRVALLMNLRDNHGECALATLPALGIASMRRIAEIIEMPAEELASLWRDLPLSDLDIAARLGISRQQVINLRKAARQRLVRRMTGNIDSVPPSKREKNDRA
jgi:hypothetical protein